MATRFYLPGSSAAPGISPAIDPTWIGTGSSGIIRRKTSTTKSGSTLVTTADTQTVANGSTSWFAMVQFISPPITAQTITGTVQSICRGLASTGIDCHLDLSLRVLSGDGLTVRGTLFSASALLSFGSPYPTGTAASEIFAGGAQTLSSVTSQAGDVIVLEIGEINDGGGTVTATLSFQDDQASDYTAGGDTTVQNPWVELSFNVAFQPVTGANNQLMMMGVGT